MSLQLVQNTRLQSGQVAASDAPFECLATIQLQFGDGQYAKLCGSCAIAASRNQPDGRSGIGSYAVCATASLFVEPVFSFDQVAKLGQFAQKILQKFVQPAVENLVDIAR